MTMPLSASHPLARHAPEHWPDIGRNAGPASPESADAQQRPSYLREKSKRAAGNCTYDIASQAGICRAESSIWIKPRGALAIGVSMIRCAETGCRSNTSAPTDYSQPKLSVRKRWRRKLVTAGRQALYVPTSPNEIWSINGKFRDECLSDHYFSNLAYARTLIAARRKEEGLQPRQIA